MESSIRKVGYQVPQVELYTLDENIVIKKTPSELFNNKKVVLFSLVGAFNSVCQQQVTDVINSYQDFIAEGIDRVYLLFTNDIWVLKQLDNELNINSTGNDLELISDGNCYFTSTMGYLVTRSIEGYGSRSWRYAMVVNNGIIEKVFAESNMVNDSKYDPYEVSTPSAVLEYLRS